MTRQIHQSAQVTGTPDEVWAVVGDVAGAADWIPALESSRLEGDVRHAEFAGGGGSARERIVAHDPTGRTYTYEYLDGPLALDVYRSTLLVRADPDGEGSVVDWTAEFAAVDAATEPDLATAIDGIYAGALAELQGRFGD